MESILIGYRSDALIVRYGLADGRIEIVAGDDGEDARAALDRLCGVGS